MTKQNRFIISTAISVLAAALLILGLVVLPDTLVMQVRSDGSAGTTMPKLLGLLVSFAISILFSVLYYIRAGKPKDLVFAVLGLAMFGFTFFFNL